jgi:hypothetical protein
MKHITKFGVAALAALALTATAASAQVIQMTATLSAGDETPALLSGAVGTAEVGVDVAAQELSIVLRVFNLPTASTAGHIHVGPKGVAGPIVIDFPNIPGRTGDFVISFRVNQAAMRVQAAQGINTMEDVIQAITGGNAYVNIHSTTNPGGEIRGQLAVAARP